MSYPAFLANYPELQTLHYSAQRDGDWQAKCNYAERLLTIKDDLEFNQEIIQETITYFHEILMDSKGKQSSYANDANLQLGLLACSAHNFDDALRLFQAVKFDVTNPLPFFEAQNQLVLIHLNKDGGYYNHLHALAAYKKVIKYVHSVNLDVLPKHINILIINAIQANEINPSYSDQLKNELFYKINRLEFHFGIINLDQYQTQLEQLAFSQKSTDRLKVKAYYQLIITSINQAQKSKDPKEISRYFNKALGFAEAFKEAKDLDSSGKRALRINNIILPALLKAKASGVITNPKNLWNAINNHEEKIRYGLKVLLRGIATFLSLVLYLNPLIFAIAAITYWARVAFASETYKPKYNIIWDFFTRWGFNLIVPTATKILTPMILILSFCASFIAKAVYDLATNNPANMKNAVDKISTKIEETYTTLNDSLHSVTNPSSPRAENQPKKIGTEDLFSESYIHQLFQPSESEFENNLYPDINDLKNDNGGYQPHTITTYLHQ